jgi:hypothetical protein
MVEEPYRDSVVQTRLSNARAHLVRAIDTANVLVIYGLAISPLDVELGEVIAAGLHEGRVEEIQIVDPDFRNVAERIATFGNAGSRERPIFARSPTALTNVWRFNADELVD